MIEAQVQSLFEQGASPEEIAQELSLEPTTVKHILQSTSADGFDFSPEDRLTFMQGIRHIAKYAENERNRLQACIYGDEVARGIKSAKSTGPQINVLAINEAIIRSTQDVFKHVQESKRKRIEAAAGDAAGAQIIEIETADASNGNGSAHSAEEISSAAGQ